MISAGKKFTMQTLKPPSGKLKSIFRKLKTACNRHWVWFSWRKDKSSCNPWIQPINRGWRGGDKLTKKKKISNSLNDLVTVLMPKSMPKGRFINSIFESIMTISNEVLCVERCWKRGHLLKTTFSPKCRQISISEANKQVNTCWCKKKNNQRFLSLPAAINPVIWIFDVITFHLFKMSWRDTRALRR